jgi:SAM-dependent methyltransferase
MIRRLAGRVVYSEAVLATNVGYRFALRRQFGAGRPRGSPDAPWRNAVLTTRAEWEAAVAQATALGLPPYYGPPSKNWDGLAALACILRHIRRSAPVLDAGAAEHSMILPWLFLYGYTNLFGINIEFDRAWKRGSIRYEPGDITKTRFGANTFEAVVCQSVLEHGVDVPAYLREMARIVRPGGLLMTSVDYYDEPVDTHGVTPDGLPYRVFNRTDIGELLSTAGSLGLTLTDPIDLTCQERAVKWDSYGLEYTFLLLTMRKA